MGEVKKVWRYAGDVKNPRSALWVAVTGRGKKKQGYAVFILYGELFVVIIFPKSISTLPFLLIHLIALELYIFPNVP